MDLRQLRYFLAVADAGQFTAAAAELGIQQPPLSQQIGALEQQLGMRLFRRHARGVALTDGGQALEREARRLLPEFDAMSARLRAVASGEHGVLQLAFTSSAAAHAFMPMALRACRQRHPGIEWVVSERNAADITEGVADGTLHCGFVRVPVARPEGVVTLTLLHEGVVAALPADHPLARRPVVRPLDLHEQPLILVRRPGAPGLYANLLERCGDADARPRVVSQVERMMTALNLVAAGVGITVVPASMKGAHARAIAYRRFSSRPALEAPLTLLYRADRRDGALTRFIVLLSELADQARPPAAARGRARAARGRSV